MFRDFNIKTMLLLGLYFLFRVVVRTDAQIPVLVKGPMDTTGGMGGSVSFDCQVTTESGFNILWSKTSPSFQWISRDGMLFGDGNKFSVQKDGGEPSYTLEISNLETSDAGVYECSYEYEDHNVFGQVLGSAELTVMENSPPDCQYVQLPSDNDTVVDLSCSWSPTMSNSPATLYHGDEELQPDFIMNDRIVSRQGLQRIDQTSEFECRWRSSPTGPTTICSFPPSAAAEIRLGVDPYVNSVVENQTARFTCHASFEPPTAGEDITYSWSLFKNGVPVDLGARQKGFMKQSMKILAVEVTDNGLVVECTARNTSGTGTLGFGSLNVYSSPLMTTRVPPKITTKLQTETSNKSSLAPRGGTISLSITITIILVVLVIVILVLALLLIVMARSKLKRSNTIRFRRKTDGRLEPFKEENFQRSQEVVYPDPNPDIIQAHSSLPLYAMPDKLMKANTVDGRARYPPKHYLPRRQSHGESVLTETEFTQHSPHQLNENYPNLYEDIDCEAIEDATRSRSKSHTVTRFNRMTSDGDAVKMPFTAAAPQRKYRGMKSANSTSALYDKPEKPQRNRPRDASPLNRKSWDLPGSIENLCNSVSMDTRSLRSFTASICEQDGYACVEDDYDDIEGDTMKSDYMDMNPIPNETDVTTKSAVVMTQENITSTAGDADMPVYAQIKR